MGIKLYKPVTSSMRTKTGLSFGELSRRTPEKSLTRGTKSFAGRGNGRISVRHRGSGHKRKYRLVDFRRIKDGLKARVAAIEYDPNRSANIALLHYEDGQKAYILAPSHLSVGDVLENGSGSSVAMGNHLPLEDIPVGTVIHNVELVLGKGGQLARSAGTSASLMALEGDYAIVKLPSGEVRMVFKKCRATVGVVGNSDHNNVSLGKAGRRRWMGRRPHVRGVVMNPHDHPLGGGNGKTSGGRHPVSPWGQPAKGFKTRSKNKLSEKFIVSRAKKKKRK